MIRSFLLSALVLVTSAQAAPPPGHPSTDQAAKLLGLPQQQAMPYEGRVLEAIDSNQYTYILVEGPAEQRLWLVAPRLALQVGSRIRFGDGMVMENFYSKKLKRRFDSVMFVSGVEAAKAAP